MIRPFALKTSDSLGKIHSFHHIFDSFSLLPFYVQERIAPAALRSSQFVPIALYKRATMSNSLVSAFKKERNRDLLFGKERITISLT